MLSIKKENRSDKPINHPGRNQPLHYLAIIVMRPPLLQKEGKLLWTNRTSILQYVCLCWSFL